MLWNPHKILRIGVKLKYGATLTGVRASRRNPRERRKKRAGRAPPFPHGVDQVVSTRRIAGMPVGWDLPQGRHGRRCRLRQSGGWLGSRFACGDDE
jgi:hypothetical protein